MQRLPDFDGLRFILCLGIAAFHYSFRVPVGNETITSVILRFSYFTDIFFIVSGLFLARRRNHVWNWRSYIAFVAKRLARIYPLHLMAFSGFALISILTAYGLLHPNVLPDMSLKNAFTQLFLIHSWGVGKTFSYNYVSWSLSALFLMYLSFPLFDVLSKRFGGRILAAVIVSLIGGELLAQWMGAPSITRAQFADIGVVRVLPSFLFGMWLARQKHRILPPQLIQFGLVACTLVFVFYEPSHSAGDAPTLEGPSRLAFLYLLTFLFYVASAQSVYTPLQWPGFAPLSRYSFGIFILHPLVGLFFFNALPSSWGHGVAGALLLIATGVAVSVLVAAISWKVFESPVNRWLVARIEAWLKRTHNPEVQPVSSTNSA